MIGTMCSKPVVTVTPTASVRDAARVMRLGAAARPRTAGDAGGELSGPATS